MRLLRGTIVIALVAILAIPGSAFAAGSEQGRVVVGGRFTLQRDEVLDGDLVVIGGVATLEQGSIVEGGVVVIGGLVTAEGEINGDLVAVGGIVNLSDSALLRGDLVGAGAMIDRDAGARVLGEVTTEGWDEGWLQFGPWVSMPPVFRGWIMPGFHEGRFWFDPMVALAWWVLRSFLMAGLAGMIVAIWPERGARAARAIVEQPVAAGAIGLGTIVVGVAVIVALAITFCLIPFSVIAGLILAAAWAFGWAALGLALGWRMTQVFRQGWSPVAQAALGTLVLSLAASAFAVIPCVGWAIPTVLGLLGLGAVTQTRFGGQEPRIGA